MNDQQQYWKQSLIPVHINGPSWQRPGGGYSCGHVLTYHPGIRVSIMGHATSSYISQYKQQQEEQVYCYGCKTPMIRHDYEAHLVFIPPGGLVRDYEEGEWICPNDDTYEITF